MVKKLIISPHIDDDVLGCGGIIDNETFVAYGGVEDFHIIDRESRIKEADAVKEFLGHDYKILNNEVNFYRVKSLIDQYQHLINDLKPHEVYVPHPSYNQDHRAVYDAVIIALRPHDNNFFVKKVLLYEQPHMFLWNQTNRTFKPNYFVKIDIEKKITAYKLMKSQVRDFRSPEILMSMAQLRGSQSNMKYAESYEIIRCVE